MSEENTPEPIPDRAEKVRLYLETLRARMDPQRFAVLSDAVRDITEPMAKGQGGDILGGRIDPEIFTPEVRREVPAVLTIVTTGRMDHHLVEVPDPDGGSMWVAVAPETAEDPEKMRELRESMLRRAADDELDGIARAGGLDPD